MAFYRRSDLQKMAEAKLKDAMLLLQNKRWSNAYYLAGYAVEIGLKACIAKQITSEVIPDKKFITDTYTHELVKLVGIAGLSQDLAKAKADPAFGTNWALVAQWSESKRYEATDALEAQYFISAVSDSSKGVFPWIQQHW